MIQSFHRSHPKKPESGLFSVQRMLVNQSAIFPPGHAVLSMQAI